METGFVEGVARDAREGDALSCAKLAMLIHVYPEQTRPLGINPNYERLLANALHNASAELLVCIGEELGKGALLARDGRLSAQFYERADRTSPFMGAYMLGRIVAARGDVRLTNRFLDKAIEAGHTVSKALKLRFDRVRWRYVPLLRPIFLMAEMSAFIRAFGQTQDDPARLRISFWRYRDLVPKGIPVVDELSCRRPSAFLCRRYGSFRGAVQKTRPDPLERNLCGISPRALLPSFVLFRSLLAPCSFPVRFPVRRRLDPSLAFEI